MYFQLQQEFVYSKHSQGTYVHTDTCKCYTNTMLQKVSRMWWAVCETMFVWDQHSCAEQSAMSIGRDNLIKWLLYKPFGCRYCLGSQWYNVVSGIPRMWSPGNVFFFFFPIGDRERSHKITIHKIIMWKRACLSCLLFGLAQSFISLHCLFLMPSATFLQKAIHHFKPMSITPGSPFFYFYIAVVSLWLS